MGHWYHWKNKLPMTMHFVYFKRWLLLIYDCLPTPCWIGKQKNTSVSSQHKGLRTNLTTFSRELATNLEIERHVSTLLISLGKNKALLHQNISWLKCNAADIMDIFSESSPAQVEKIIVRTVENIIVRRKKYYSLGRASIGLPNL